MQFASLNRIKSATALFPFAIIALALNGKIENDFCLFLLKTIAPSNALIFRDWVLCSLRFDLGKNRGNFGTIILFLEVSNVVLENNCILTKTRFLDTFKPGDKMIGLVTKTCDWCVNLFSITEDWNYMIIELTLFENQSTYNNSLFTIGILPTNPYMTNVTQMQLATDDVVWVRLNY